MAGLALVCLLLAAPAAAAEGPPPGAAAAEQAGAALIEGKPEQALQAALECRDPRCALIAARALLALQRPADAAATLATAAGRLGLLEAHGQALLGESLLLAGEGAKALEPLRRSAALDVDGPVGQRATALEADALLAAGQPREAARHAAQALLDHPEYPVDLRASLTYVRALALARIAAQEPSPDANREAALAARALWVKFPDHPGAPQARLDEAKLAPLPAPEGREMLQRANRLMLAGLPARAIEAAKEAIELVDEEDEPEAHLLLAKTYAAAGQRSLAAKPLAMAWKHGGARSAPAAGLLLARDHGRHGRLREAIQLLDTLARKYPHANEAPEAQLVAARLSEEAGNAADAKRRLARLAKGKGPRPQDARWALAWMAYRAKAKDAAARFAQYAAQATDAVEKARGLYWAARAGAKKKQKLLEQVAALDPLGYYGALALAALGRASSDMPPFPAGAARVGREATPTIAADAADEENGEHGRLQAGEELAGLGLCAESAAELDRYVKSIKRDATGLLRALPVFEKCRRFDRAVTLSQAANGAPDAGERRALLRHSYPHAFSELVGRTAKRTGLDPYLLLALARRESLFRTDAHSAAGAVGLVQVLPKTASRIAAVLGRPPPEPETLADPAIALDLGSWYLSELLGAFGDPAIAAAAYNAGPQSVRKWLKGKEGTPLDVWIEEIPFRETRLYVRYVVGGWSAYRLLAGGSAPALSGEVPEPRAGIAF